MKKKKIFILVVVIFSFILCVVLIRKAIGRASSGSNASNPVAATTLDQSVWVLGRDSEGKAIENYVEITFTKAEKTKSVLIQGKPATAKDDKFFLVLYFEIKNDSNRILYLLPVDLIRLVKPDGKLFAPSVHQNLVETRPTSTKVTNVGFVVEKGEKEFVLRVGEVGGEKSEVRVKF